MPAVASAHTGGSAAVSGRFYWLYDKDQNAHTNGRLYLRHDLGGGQVSTIATWRAGSGQGSNAFNECAVGEGWLPNGKYSVTPYKNWNGSVIHGPVLRLSDHACSNGTKRTELFVHSSYPWSSGHYNSDGCLKVANDSGPSPATGTIEKVYNETVTYHVSELYVIS